jgi:hypothetical protein
VKWMLSRRPSPAMVVALIALFVALGGVSYGFATGEIDSREIKNNEIRSVDLRNNQIRTRDLRNNEVRGIDIRNSTIQSRDIAINAVRGEDVKEDTLAKVPSALLADSATTAAKATTADDVGGLMLRRIAFSGELGGEFEEILNVGGLTLQAHCTAGPNVEVQATTTVANSEISSDFVGALTNPDFDPGEDFTAADTGGENGLIAYAGSDGRVITVTGMTVSDSNDVRGTTDDCGFFGVAEVG